jgi:hypothetical protein
VQICLAFRGMLSQLVRGMGGFKFRGMLFSTHDSATDFNSATDINSARDSKMMHISLRFRHPFCLMNAASKLTMHPTGFSDDGSLGWLALGGDAAGLCSALAGGH